MGGSPRNTEEAGMSSIPKYYSERVMLFAFALAVLARECEKAVQGPGRPSVW